MSMMYEKDGVLSSFIRKFEKDSYMVGTTYHICRDELMIVCIKEFDVINLESIPNWLLFLYLEKSHEGFNLVFRMLK